MKLLFVFSLNVFWLYLLDGVLMSGRTVFGVRCCDLWYFWCCLGEIIWFSAFSWLSRIDFEWLYDVCGLGWSQSWRTASSGVIRFFGSHLKGKQRINTNVIILLSGIWTYSKHLLIKSLNMGSLHRSACANAFEPGLRLRPFELVTHRGLHRESKNKRFRVAVLMRSSGGTPRTSMMQASCSTSFSPGNNG